MGLPKLTAQVSFTLLLHARLCAHSRIRRVIALPAVPSKYCEHPALPDRAGVQKSRRRWPPSSQGDPPHVYLFRGLSLADRFSAI